MSFALVSLLWCNRFIFIDVDCEDVKNRTHAFWNRSSRLTKNFIETNSLIVVANSLSAVEANRHWDWRSEAKRIKRKKNFLFEILNDCFVDLMWNCCCVWFLFFSLTSDVSTLQKDEYCRNYSRIDERTDSKSHENRLLTECRLISTNKKIDYWKIVILADSRSFSLIHDASNENKMQSSFSKRKFIHSRRFTIIFVDSRRFVKIRFVVSLTKIRSVTSWSFSRKFSFRWFENALCKFHSTHEDVMLRDLSLKEFHILAILFYLLAYLDEQLTCFDRAFDWMSLSFAKFRARNRCAEDVKMISSSSLQLIENCAVNVIVANWNFVLKRIFVTNWSILFLSTRWSWKRVWSLHRSSRWKSNIMSKIVLG